jgi:hypothetical protein
MTVFAGFTPCGSGTSMANSKNKTIVHACPAKPGSARRGGRYGSRLAEDELSEKSISNHLKTIKSLFKFAFEKDHIDANQMAKVKFNPEGGRKKPPFTPAERKTIFELAWP